jgi:hypothetical protein
MRSTIFFCGKLLIHLKDTLLSNIRREGHVMSTNILFVTPDASKELKERVHRLRYQVYVGEMKHNLANDERMLHDKYDEYSTNLLAEVDGEDVATIRYTAKRNGPMESEEQHESWRSSIWTSEKDPDTVCELARWIVRQDHRATSVGLMLGQSVYKYCMRQGTFRMYCWAKAGALANYYRKLRWSDCVKEPLPFTMGNHVVGQYILMHLDLGSPWSLRRTSTRLRYGFLKVLAAISLPLRNALLGRGRGYSHQS